jgi:hypothetical protein
MSEEISKKEEKPGFEDSWWGKIGFGLLLAGLTFYLNNLFTELETGVQESVRIHALIALLYNTLGHMPTVIIFGGLAVLCVIWGVYQLATGRKDD